MKQASIKSTLSKSVAPTRFCAIYTRKSSEEGLEQNFNSLDAQREACEAYVLSQKAEGWLTLPQMYDDGGFSGGNIERPGLQQLMRDIEAKKVNIVVVYKVDRLTRSLADFAKLVELFDAYGVSFVSITQQFNTTSSMGRLTLNVLLSFAQFEREVTSERIRDKIRASKAKGMWMGGMPPVGYYVEDKTLIPDSTSALLVQDIFELYLEAGSVRTLKAELDSRGIKTPERLSKRQGQSGGKSFCRGHLYRILSNPLYTGKVAHKGKLFDGQHEAIIDQALWDEVQARLLSNRQGHRSRASCKAPGLLAGLLFDQYGERLTSVQSNKPALSAKGEDCIKRTGYHQRRYHYYISQRIIKEGKAQVKDAQRIPAHELEQAVITRLCHFLQQGSELFTLIDQHGLKDTQAVTAILQTASELAVILSNNTAPAEQIRILNDLTDKIVVHADRLEITIKLKQLITDASKTSHLPATTWECFDWDNQSYTVTLPVEIKRSGLNVRVIIKAPEHEIRRHADKRIVQLLSRAQHYFNLITSGKVSSFKEISVRENLTSAYITKVTMLAFLSPDIVKDILDGRQPPSLTSDKLMRTSPLPTDWTEQRKVLGFR